jgi:hypothetical protein
VYHLKAVSRIPPRSLMLFTETRHEPTINAFAPSDAAPTG